MESSLTDMIEGKVEELRLAMLGNDGDVLDGLFARELSWAIPLLTSRVGLNAWRTFPSASSYSRR